MCGCAVYACTLEANNRILPALTRTPWPALRFLRFPPFKHSGTTPDKSERLASRQSNRLLDPLGFLFPKRRPSTPPSPQDPTPATPKTPSNPFRRFRAPSRASTVPTPQPPPPPRSATMTAAPAFDHYQPALHAKNNNLKAWWKQFTFAQRTKKEVDEKKGVSPLLSPLLDVPVPIRRFTSPTPTPLAYGPERRFWETPQGEPQTC